MDTTLQAEPRTVIGKQVRQLRRQGVIPANLYGNGLESRPLQLPERLVTHRLARASRSTLFELALDGGQPQTVLVKSMQRDPVSGRVLHVDFYAVRMTEKLRATVSLHFTGEPPAVRQSDGTLMTSFDTVEVESLPGDLPTVIEVDVSGLATFDDALYVRDLSVPAGVEILSPAGDEVLAKVLPPRVEVEEVAEVEEAAAEAAATAEAPEGEQPAEASAEGSTEAE